MTRKLCVSVIVIAGLLTALSSHAWGAERIESFETTMSTSQAGGHPDLVTSFSLESPGDPEAAKSVVFDAPAGVFGNPRAVEECNAADFALDQCPPDSQVGLITIRADYEGNPDFLLGTAPVFATVPESGEAARFAFVAPILHFSVAIPVAVRTTADYGLRFTVSDISETAPLAGAHLTLWGVPAATGHNGERFPKGSPGAPTGCPHVEGAGCIATPTEASIPPEPLIDNPTVCSGELLRSTLEVRTYQDPAQPSFARAYYPMVEGCEREVFDPAMQASLTTSAADSSSGLDMDLSAPQFETAAASPSEIRSITTTLPKGLTINPDAADGLAACTPAQAGLTSEGPSNCPDSSKIGAFQIGTPALAEPLNGALYLGEPIRGTQYRVFLIASGSGLNVKFVSSLLPNALTGQVTVQFPELPQVPFEDLRLHLFSGERGLLATPNFCSNYSVITRFTPWDSLLAPQTSTQYVGIDTGPGGSPCPGQVRPFTPSLQAGTSNSTAGAHSSFTLDLTREDGNQNLGALNFTLPSGLLANMRGVTYCPDSSIAAAAALAGRVEQSRPSCPPSSQIGTTEVSAGPGTHPFHVGGAIYMAGPFEGAPLSLVAITPALSGPYDYGTEVIRVALHIDPRDAHVVADSEAVPEILGGVPLRLRSIRVNIDRPGFMVNPTDCAPKGIDSEGVGDQGTVARFSSYFDAVNCSILPFKPRLTIRQLGRQRATQRGRDPRLRFDLYTSAGEANIKSLAVTLPSSLEIDQRHLTNICSRSELLADHCKDRAALGEAVDWTPLLEKPLSGLVYAVSGYGRLPHIAFILGGQVTIIPEALTTSVGGKRLEAFLPAIPDAPIGHFRLTVFGGQHGYLRNTRDLCASPAQARVRFAGQNGASLTRWPTVRAACKAPAKPQGHHGRSPRDSSH